MSKNLDYIVFFITLVLTTFEYFFRADMLFFAFSLLIILLSILRRGADVVCDKYAIAFIIIFLFIICLQPFFITRYKFTSIISRCVSLFGAFFIANILYKRFAQIVINIIYWISIPSLIIYGLTFIPSVRDLFLFQLAPMFPSLNVQEAMQEGGGLNIIIYNFQTTIILDTVGFMRNCGPFWEPGMYAVFLNIALAFNLFIYKSSNKWINRILFLALVTTFSTGGYVVGLLLMMLTVLFGKTNPVLKVLSVIMVVVACFYVVEFDFIGDKINTQIETATIGSDNSRFGAILTQLKMIEASPFIGGEDISKYISGHSQTLASGILMPIVQLGIPMGLFYMLSLLASLVFLSDSYNRKKIAGGLLFIIILVLSISQTILMSSFVMILLFVGFNRRKQHIIKYGTI